MKIIVYDHATGAIKRMVTCPASCVTSQVKTGEAQIERPSDFTGDHTTHQVVDGEVVPIQ
jgi:hypothetical protein